MADYAHDEFSEHPCGTPSCICGWWEFMNGRRSEGLENRAAEEMGLQRMHRITGLNRAMQDAPYLFRTDPPVEALGRNPTATDAAKVIRHFALTGEEDWSVAR